MTQQPRREIIEVLDCDIGARPKGAPGIDALVPHVRGAQRTAGAVIVDLNEGAAQTLEAFVAAERRCCADIGWEIEPGTPLRLRISASEDQLNAIESLWHQIESHQ